MTVDLKPEQQQIVERAIAAGIVSTHDDVFELGIQAIRVRLETTPGTDSPRPSKEERMRFVDEFINRHEAGRPLLSDEDISRDCIYGARGL